MTSRHLHGEAEVSYSSLVAMSGFKLTQRSWCRAGSPGSRCHRLHHSPASLKPAHAQTHTHTVSTQTHTSCNQFNRIHERLVASCLTVPREPWTSQCNTGSSISRCPPWAVWQNQNHISWCILGGRCHRRNEYCSAWGPDARPSVDKRTCVTSCSDEC